VTSGGAEVYQGTQPPPGGIGRKMSSRPGVFPHRGTLPPQVIEKHMPATSTIVVKARRERGGLLRSLARFTGLAALSAAVARSPLFRTRQNTATTGGVLLSLIAGVVMMALLIPSARQPIASVLKTPGQLLNVLGGGASSNTSDKGYPRIYSVKLNIDLPIQPGDGGVRPAVQPIAFQYPNTAPVGQPGNTYLYAHDRQGMFLGLHKAVIGDVIIVAVSPTEKLYFQITEIHGNVAWNDLKWLGHTGDTRLTLQTCNFSGDFDPRFIVVSKAIPVDEGRRLTNGA
jgi:hypothetical protein